MTNAQIIAIVISVITSVVLAPLANAIVRKYAEPNLPDKKTIRKWVDALMTFLSLVGPIASIVIEMNVSKSVDKGFVLRIAFFVGAFVYNILMFFLFSVMSSLRSTVDHTGWLVTTVKKHGKLLKDRSEGSEL